MIVFPIRMLEINSDPSVKSNVEKCRKKQTVMKTIPLSLSVIALAALASCASDPAVTRRPVSLNVDTQLSTQVFEDVNAYRSSLGVRELQRHAGLDRLANGFCEYLRANSGNFEVYGKYVSHMGYEGRSLIAMRRLNMMSTSENIASTMSLGSDSQTAKKLVGMWQSSPDHHDSMRCPAWTHTGVGAVTGADGRVYATQIFSTKNFSEVTSYAEFNQF